MGVTSSKSKPYKIQTIKPEQTVLYNVCEKPSSSPALSVQTTKEEALLVGGSSSSTTGFSTTRSNSNQQVKKAISSPSISPTTSNELSTLNGTAESGNLKSILSNKSGVSTVRPIRSVTLIFDIKEQDELIVTSPRSKGSPRGIRRNKYKHNDPIEEDCIDIRVLSHRRASLPSVVSYDGSTSSAPERKIIGNFTYDVDVPYSPAESTKTAPTISNDCWESPSIRIIPPPEDLLKSDPQDPLPKKSTLKEEKTRKLQEKRMNTVKKWSKEDLQKLSSKKTKRSRNPIAEDLMYYK